MVESPIAVIYDRYEIYKDGAIYDTYNADDIPKEVFDIRDLLMKKIHVNLDVVTIYYLIKCENHNMFEYPQVLGKSYDKEKLLDILKESYKKYDAKFTVNKYRNGNLIQIVVDIYDDQEVYWITSDFEFTQKVVDET